MKVLITGASSGIGLDMARYLATKKYELILVSRNKEKLEKIQEELPTKVTIIVADLSNEQKVKELYVLAKKENIDIIINNAGLGDFGPLTDTDLNKDLELINTNIKALHILTKSLVKDMEKRDTDTYILNVASIAGHLPGPFMSTYYATKHYVFNLSESINEELKKDRSHVRVGTLNPGPVETNFNKVANVKFNLSSLTSEYVAKYTVDRMLKGKTDITPGFGVRCTRFFAKVVPDTLMAKIVYNTQKKRG